MVRFLVLYDPPEDQAAFDKHYDEVHIPTGVCSMVYKVAEV
jgi:hypothetical protein